MRVPWLIVGTLLGAFLGLVCAPITNEMYYPLVGAICGLLVGLVLDLDRSINPPLRPQRKDPPDVPD